MGAATWHAAFFACPWAGRRSTRIRTPTCLAAVGGLVVILGRLAAVRIEPHSYWLLTALPVIASLVVGRSVAELAALAPAGCLRLNRT